jgi:septum formation inhibitor MinC
MLAGLGGNPRAQIICEILQPALDLGGLCA